jgi:hypothetical protein
MHRSSPDHVLFLKVQELGMPFSLARDFCLKLKTQVPFA